MQDQRTTDQTTTGPEDHRTRSQDQTEDYRTEEHRTKREAKKHILPRLLLEAFKLRLASQHQ